jgi:hypothetical protein
MGKLNIVNYIIMGDKTVRFDDLTPEEKRMVANKLNEQALTAVGYKKRVTTKETA